MKRLCRRPLVSTGNQERFLLPEDGGGAARFSGTDPLQTFRRHQAGGKKWAEEVQLVGDSWKTEQVVL